MTQPLKLVVGSTNPVKVAAAKAALAPFFPGQAIDCVGLSAPSGVPDQPMTEADTRLGAINRVAWCQQQTEADYYLAMEGGVDEFEDGPATFAVVVIADNRRRSVGRSANLPLPPVLFEGLKQGEELGPLIDKLFGTTNIKQKGGAIGLLTRDLATRQSTYELALTLAMAPFLNPELFDR
ncbi:inosine/xanthosine triphosphatase [Gallaecimonas pentaromativorans]|uniref:Inosine/xanthosine triphosphatase n=1 Tax=Gallaecimonas pentaromativorans TaxID=584787 RepID=A0A3N1PP00_9GAMM|nr:inosine/xanthosine triphosphatase [Gallaecimonas pentaromativorans]MED5524603.1 inosine/xanthosine triphosphatase [Pseudomonadota bacterium]ROQ28610.1 inosine/xanthosine triphosphatase [Gallaecimonas pentaromativorans]